jgi:hypothetical protein
MPPHSSPPLNAERHLGTERLLDSAFIAFSDLTLRVIDGIGWKVLSVNTRSASINDDQNV